MGDLSENSSPPNKRRRRRLIVALLLTLVSLPTWWYWPRRDARFVGEWQSENGDRIHLAADGACQMTSNIATGYKATIYFSWAVRGNTLVMQTARSSLGLERLKEELEHIYDELRGVPWYSLRFRVLEFSQARIELESLGGSALGAETGTRMTWRRSFD